MAEQKKTLSAKQVVADIRSGATDEFLMKKYGLAEKGLKSLFQKLIAAKVISQSELDRRTSGVEEVEAVIVEDKAADSPKEKSVDVLKNFSERFKFSKEDLERLKTASLKDIKQLMEKYNISLSDSKELLKTLGISAGSLLTQAAGKLKDGTRRLREEVQQRQSTGEKEGQLSVPPKPAESPQEQVKKVGGKALDRAKELRGKVPSRWDFGRFKGLFKTSKTAVVEPVSGPKRSAEKSPGLPLNHDAAFSQRRKRIPATMASRLSSIFTRRSLLKLAVYVLAVVVFAVSVELISPSDTVDEFTSLKLVDPLPHARKLCEEGKYCEALNYLGFFLEYPHVRANPEVTKFYEYIKNRRESLWGRTQNVVGGVLRGEGDCLEALVSATASDFLVIGDVRDLISEGMKKWRGEEADDLTAALAGVGPVLTVVGPATATLKGAVSLFKITKKLKKIPKPLQKHLTKSFKQATKTRSVVPLKAVVKPFEFMVKNYAQLKQVQLTDLIEFLSHCQSLEDLALLETAISAFGNKTGKLVKLGGHDTLGLLQKFGKNPNIQSALDHAVQYGTKGTGLLARVGPDKYLEWADAPSKASRRKIAGSSPLWATIPITALSGLVVIGWPTKYLFNVLRRRRQNN